MSIFIVMFILVQLDTGNVKRLMPFFFFYLLNSSVTKRIRKTTYRSRRRKEKTGKSLPRFLRIKLCLDILKRRTGFLNYTQP